ncbi:hypothetical protein [uncultured Zobellia sp.]|uniref:hypothetical protein n=1 Tax=uncultured Zobellia sp. TaxID=255433 RepID=UPI0025926826|nr:hypothetical protein [uncultured Zobellia sp.]
MKLNRYEKVREVICILDERITKLLIEEDVDHKKLMTLIDVRTIYVKEYEGLTRSKETKDMYTKKNGYEM